MYYLCMYINCYIFYQREFYFVSKKLKRFVKVCEKKILILLIAACYVKFDFNILCLKMSNIIGIAQNNSILIGNK